SELFRLELDVLALASSPVAFDKLLGQAATVKVQMPQNQFRYFNGIVSRLSQGDRLSAAGGGESLVRYTLEVVPKLWLLTHAAQSRIFQQMAVPDILKAVLKGLDVDWQIQGTFDPRDYCSQYRETDFNFATRLME